MGSLRSLCDWFDVTDTRVEVMDDFTTRDLFAGLALVGILAHHGAKPYDKVAKEAYGFAEEMLKEKERRDGVTE
jgi:hypothetical protein